MKCLRSKFKLLTLTAMLLSTSGYALPASQKLNLREACRQAIAGEYISAFDSVRTATGYLSESDKMIVRIANALATEEKTLHALRAKVERVTYNTQFSDQVIHQTEKVKALESTLNLYREQSATAKEKIKIVQHRESYLKFHITPVFTITKEKGAGKDYPSGIEYKSGCPKYRHMCPLPVEFHDALERILLNEDSEAVCKRYISYSRSGTR